LEARALFVFPVETRDLPGLGELTGRSTSIVITPSDGRLLGKAQWHVTSPRNVEPGAAVAATGGEMIGRIGVNYPCAKEVPHQ
jgi:hypothetical protein